VTRTIARGKSLVIKMMLTGPRVSGREGVKKRTKGGRLLENLIQDRNAFKDYCS